MSDGKQPTTLQVHEVSHPEPSQNPNTNTSTESPEPKSQTTEASIKDTGSFEVEVPAQAHNLEGRIFPPKDESSVQHTEADTISSVSGIPASSKASPDLQLEDEVDPASHESQVPHEEVLYSSVQEEGDFMSKAVVPKPEMVPGDAAPDGIHASPYKEDRVYSDYQISADSEVVRVLPCNADSLADQQSDGVHVEHSKADSLSDGLSDGVHEVPSKADSVSDGLSDFVHEIPSKTDSLSDELSDFVHELPSSVDSVVDPFSVGVHGDEVPGKDDSVAEQVSDGVYEVPVKVVSVPDPLSDDAHELPGKGYSVANQDSVMSDADDRIVKGPPELSVISHPTGLHPVSDTTETENTGRSEETEITNTINEVAGIEVLSEQATTITPLTGKDNNASETTETPKTNDDVPDTEANGEVPAVEALDDRKGNDVAHQQKKESNKWETIETQKNDDEFAATETNTEVPVMEDFDDQKLTAEVPVHNKEKTISESKETQKIEGDVLAIEGNGEAVDDQHTSIMPVQSKESNATETLKTNNEVEDTEDCKKEIVVSVVEALAEQEAFSNPAVNKETNASETTEIHENDIDVPVMEAAYNQEIKYAVPATKTNGKILAMEPFDAQERLVMPVQNEETNASEAIESQETTKTDVTMEKEAMENTGEKEIMATTGMTSYEKETIHNTECLLSDKREALEITKFNASEEYHAFESTESDLSEPQDAKLEDVIAPAQEMVNESNGIVHHEELIFKDASMEGISPQKPEERSSSQLVSSNEGELPLTETVSLQDSFQKAQTEVCGAESEILATPLTTDQTKDVNVQAQKAEDQIEDCTGLDTQAQNTSEEEIKNSNEEVCNYIKGTADSKVEVHQSEEQIHLKDSVEHLSVPIIEVKEHVIYGTVNNRESHHSEKNDNNCDELLVNKPAVQQDVESIEEKLVQSTAATVNPKENVEVLHGAVSQETKDDTYLKVINDCDAIVTCREVPPVEESTRYELPENGKAVRDIIKEDILSEENNNSNNSSVQPYNPVDSKEETIADRDVLLENEMINETQLIDSRDINVPFDTKVIHTVPSNEARQASEGGGGDFVDTTTPVPKEVQYNPELSTESANTHNGVPCVSPHNHVTRGEELPGDESDTSLKEKSSTGMKIPLIVAGLAIATVGVAVASISRSR